MKKLTLLLIFLSVILTNQFSQIDTISENVYINAGKIGIGTSNPNTLLRIEGNVDDGPDRALIRVKNLSTSYTSSVSIGLESNNSQTSMALTATSEQFTAIPDFDNMGVISVNGKGFSVYSTSNYGSIRFHTNMDQNGIIERMRIDAQGNVGIGTKNPNSKLEVNGMIHSTSEGFKFPDGTIQTTAAANSGFDYWNAIDNNLFYNNGKVGIGRNQFDSYFNTKLWVHEGWLQVTDSGYNDVGIVVNHLSKTGYGYARSLHQVYEGVDGDPYTEFRIRNNNDEETVTSWSFGADNSDGDKLIISNRVNHPSGASPSYGNRLIALKTTGEFGIGTDNPNSKLEVNGMIHSTSGGFKFPDGTVQTSAVLNSSDLWSNIDDDIYYNDGNVGIGTNNPKAKVEISDGDIFISDINRGIIMKSPDGQCWRGTLDNSGNLTFKPVNCDDLIIIPDDTANTTAQSLLNESEISIVPNPFDQTIRIVSVEKDIINSTFIIFNMNGKEIKRSKIKSADTVISTDDLSHGSYIIKIIDKKGNKLSSQKLIKK